ncbi:MULTISPECIES: hypothetical protein [unclassified Ornithinimicrobium]|uniref:hypothetical protein n=1 Tax=unclassified Ornithinimicrobium TaxID=2615080 RepID=UPI003853581D
MRSQRALLLGAAAAGLLSLTAVAGAVSHLWWLVVLALAVLLSTVLLVALDADRRVRELRSFVRGELRRTEMPEPRAAPSTEDVVGTVRALQAQYTGRLDRLQDAVEEMLRRDERR